MTKSELETWRKRSPWFTFVIGLSLYFVVTSKDLQLAKAQNDLIVPFIAAIATFFYVGLGVRSYLWNKEMDAYVRKQIRETLLKMIPEDLQVTSEEEEQLAEREIYGTLTGVFWEAVANDEVLTSHKEHFYANGAMYSTSIDVLIIGLILSSVFAIYAWLTNRTELVSLSIWCAVIALASRFLVTRVARKRHLVLSSEQLNLLQRRQGDFVSRRFREIIVGWRAEREL